MAAAGAGAPATENSRMPGEVAKILREYARLQSDLSRISEISSGIIYILDRDGKFTFVNRAVEEILQYAPHELIGKHFSVIMSNEEYERVSREYVLPRYAGVVTGPQSAPKLFDERRTRDRRTRNLEVRLLTKNHSGVKVLAGEVTGILSSEGAYDRSSTPQSREAAFIGSQGIIYDISRYKELELEKSELEKHLMEVEKVESLGRFAGSVAHELNNKLGVVIGYAEMLEKKYGSEEDELGQYVKMVASASRNAAELSGQMLAFSQEGKYQIVDVDINGTAEKAAQLARHALSRRTQVRTVLRADRAIVKGDPAAIRSSLISFIMKIGRDARRVSDVMVSSKNVTLDEQFAIKHSLVGNRDEYVLLTFIFAGAVLDDALRKSFHELLAGNGAGDDEYVAGGLASVVKCVRNHRGFIELTDEADTGIRFDIYLPVAAQ